jgi:hypothetical protein
LIFGTGFKTEKPRTLFDRVVRGFIMANQKKKLGIIGFIMGALVLLPRPAQAFKLPGPLNTLVDTIAGGVGLGIAEKFNGYLALGLGHLDKFLGIDPGSVSGALGVVDPLKAAQAIDEKQLKSLQNDLGITPTVEGTLEKGKFNTELGLAIGSSIFSTDTQSALKDSGEATQKLTEGSGELAQQAQSENVTQNIAKIQTKQNAQEIGVLNTLSQTGSLQLQQQAATNVSSAVTAEHANNEEQRTAQGVADEVTYTTQQSGMAQGVIEGIGK